MKSEWGKQVRALVTYLVPSRPGDSPPSVVRRHPKHENADEHSASSMFPYILPAVYIMETECYVPSGGPPRCCAFRRPAGGEPWCTCRHSWGKPTTTTARVSQSRVRRNLTVDQCVARCNNARTRMISWSSTSNREDSWCGVGRSFYFESQGLILHIWGCTLDLMSEERIRRDSEDSSFYEVVRENGRPRGNIRARPREIRDRA